jgi:hypothetical protein
MSPQHSRSPLVVITGPPEMINGGPNPKADITKSESTDCDLDGLGIISVVALPPRRS